MRCFDAPRWREQHGRADDAVVVLGLIVGMTACSAGPGSRDLESAADAPETLVSGQAKPIDGSYAFVFDPSNTVTTGPSGTTDSTATA